MAIIERQGEETGTLAGGYKAEGHCLVGTYLEDTTRACG